jgi:TetR/AcrR family transcriptional repressor of nem operon
MPTTSKEKIIEIGAEIIHQKGYNHTGIQEILNASNVPKGSFYNYFKSKEDFGLQVIDYFTAHYNQMALETLANTSMAPLDRIHRFLTDFIDYFRSQGCTGGCPIGNLAQEMGDLSPKFSLKLKASIDLMVDAYAGVLAEAQKAGDIPESLEIKEAAYFMVASWHGAIIQMKLTKTLASLETHRKFIFNNILKA